MLGDIVFNNSNYVMEVQLINLKSVELSIKMIGRVLVIKTNNGEWSCKLRDSSFLIIINIVSSNITFINIRDIRISSFNIKSIDSHPFCINFTNINVGTMNIDLSAPIVRLINTFIVRFNVEKLIYDSLKFTGKINSIDGDASKFSDISIDKLNDPCVLSYTCKYII